MTSALDAFDFTLAENLGMTVEQMQRTVSNQEYLQWRALYHVRSEMQKLEND